MNLSVEDLASTRGDGLCAVAENLGNPHVGLSAKEVDSAKTDYDAVPRWLATCAMLHPQTCLPQGSKDLETICLIDVLSRRLVSYSAHTAEYLALSYVCGEPQESVPGAGTPGTLKGH